MTEGGQPLPARTLNRYRFSLTGPPEVKKRKVVAATFKRQFTLKDLKTDFVFFGEQPPLSDCDGLQPGSVVGLRLQQTPICSFVKAWVWQIMAKPFYVKIQNVQKCFILNFWVTM